MRRPEPWRQVDEELGWEPLPAGPADLHPLLEQGQRAFWEVLSGGGGTQGLLDELVSSWEAVLAHPVLATASAPFRTAVLNRVGIAHNWAAVHRRDVSGLDRAAARFEEGLRLAPEGAADVPRLLHNLAHCHLARYQLAGRDEDLAAAHRLSDQALEAATAPRLEALCAAGVAGVLTVQHRMTGAADLDRAVELARRASRLADSPRLRVVSAGALATALLQRYDVRGIVADLDEAIDCLRAAPTSSWDADAMESALGTALRRRWHRTRRAEDIEEAVAALRGCADRQGEHASPAVLTNYGNALLDLFSATGDAEAVQTAADVHERAVRLSRATDWQFASRLNNAGNAAATLHDLTGDPEALQRALAHHTQALAGTGPTAQERASREYNLGRTLQRLHRLDGSDETRARGYALYEAAMASGRGGSLEWSLAAARALGDWAAEEGRWQQAAAAYRTGLELVRELSRVQTGRAAKEAWLQEATGLPPRAARALSQVGDREGAVLALEMGRAILLSEALDGARPLAAEVGDPRDAAASLARAGVERVARDATLAYVVPAPDSGLCLVVDRSGVRLTELPGLTEHAVRRRVLALLRAHDRRRSEPGRWEGTLDAVTAWLWREVGDRLVDQRLLGQQTVVVPVGLLSLLPLHAAWRPEPRLVDGRRYLLDETVLCHAPVVSALAGGPPPATAPRRRRLLVVADPKPSAAPTVPLATAEASWVEAFFDDVTSLVGEHAALAPVRTHLLAYDVVHLACHGLSHPDRPLESSLLLGGDQRLTLRDISALRTGAGTAVGLAVLSACETARPGAALPDEVVSFPTSLLQLGVRAVVAAQWAVPGIATAALVFHLHRSIAEGEAPGSALQQAQRWVRWSTNDEKCSEIAGERERRRPTEASRALWRALRRLPPDERTHRHPVHWAAFSYVGPPERATRWRAATTGSAGRVDRDAGPGSEPA